MTARRIVGNPVNMLVVSVDEVPGLLRRGRGPWRPNLAKASFFSARRCRRWCRWLYVPRSRSKARAATPGDAVAYLLKAREFLRAAQDPSSLGIARPRRVMPSTRASQRAMFSQRHLLVRCRRATTPTRRAIWMPLAETDESLRDNSVSFFR